MFFLGHNSGSRYATRSIKGSKDGDDRQVSKKSLSQKMGQWICVHGLVKLVKNSKTCHFC